MKSMKHILWPAVLLMATSTLGFAQVKTITNNPTYQKSDDCNRKRYNECERKHEDKDCERKRYNECERKHEDKDCERKHEVKDCDKHYKDEDGYRESGRDDHHHSDGGYQEGYQF